MAPIREIAFDTSALSEMLGAEAFDARAVASRLDRARIVVAREVIGEMLGGADEHVRRRLTRFAQLEALLPRGSIVLARPHLHGLREEQRGRRLRGVAVEPDGLGWLFEAARDPIEMIAGTGWRGRIAARHFDKDGVLERSRSVARATFDRAARQQAAATLGGVPEHLAAGFAAGRWPLDMIVAAAEPPNLAAAIATVRVAPKSARTHAAMFVMMTIAAIAPVVTDQYRPAYADAFKWDRGAYQDAFILGATACASTLVTHDDGLRERIEVGRRAGLVAIESARLADLGLA